MKTFSKTKVIVSAVLVLLLACSIVGIAILSTSNSPAVVYADESVSPTSTTDEESTVEDYDGELPVVPTKPGYNFTGWYTDADCSSLYTGETITSDMTLYAGTEPITYTIQIFRNNDNLGGTYVYTIDATYGVSYTVEKHGSWSNNGYRFTGWGVDSAGNYGYKTGTTVNNLTTTQGKTVTLWAQWEEVNYTLAFDANGGSGSMDSQTLRVSQSLTLPSNTFTKTGYHFAGWSATSTGSVKWTDEATATPTTATDAEGTTVTLYAVWEANTYTINFIANSSNATGSMDSITATYGQEITLPACTFVLPGYEFSYWCVNEPGTQNSSLMKADKATVKNLTSTNGGTVTLFATWTAIQYTVKYDANGGSGTMNSQTASYDTNFTLTSNAFVRDGYKFKGWSTSKNGSVEYTDKEVVSNIAGTNTSVTLYAVWEQIMCKITFILDGEVYTTIDVAWGTPSADVIGQVVNSALYEADGSLPN